MRSLIARARSHGLVIVAAAGLSGCVTDPAFMEGLAMATQSIAAETAYMAEEARCYRHLSTSGEWVTLCPLPYGYVAPAPYIHPGGRIQYGGRDRDRGRDRDHRRDDRRKPGY